MTQTTVRTITWYHTPDNYTIVHLNTIAVQTHDKKVCLDMRKSDAADMILIFLSHEPNLPLAIAGTN